MKKLTGESLDFVQQNIETLKKLFPEIVREGKIDFDALRSVLDEEVDDSKEKYDFTWAGKQKAIRRAQQVSTGTLRPCPEESVNWDTTKNLYIEGDNLEVLRILQQTYYNKVKMIYIDPPYNTGNDFVYNDDFAETAADYVARTGQALQSNPETSGRFHSNWLNMMYPRLRLARNLLREDGVIFISISDNEIASLRQICDEIFGEYNFCANIIWNSTKSVTNTAIISVSHTHTLVYFKDMDYFKAHREEFRLPDSGEGFSNPDDDPRGPWKADPFQVGGWRPNQQYEIVNPNTGVVYKPNPGCSWKNDFNKFQELLRDNRIVFGLTGKGGPQRKRFKTEAMERGTVSTTLWTDIETTANGTQLLKKLFDGQSVFNNPKPVGFIVKLLQLGTSNKEDIILDFFAGSATTAHAVMHLNAEDGGERRFIMVQLPESCSEDSQAWRAGFENISQLAIARIKRAAKQISDERSNLDTGFKVFKLDTSNLSEWDPAATDIAKQLALQAHGIKQDRTPLDLVYEIMLKYGIDLVHPISKKELAGKSYYDVGLGALLVCLDSDIDENFVRKLAQLKPQRVVFADASFRDDNAKLNAMQILRHHGVTDVRSL